MASTAIYRTLSQNYGTGGGITTISFWFKRAKLGVTQCLTSSYYSGSFYGQFQLGSNDTLTIQDWRSANVYSKTTNMVFRDTSSWYHVCWSFNNRTGGSSSSNLWINGELITSWSSETEYSYQATTSWNTDYTHFIGCLNTSASQAYFDGLIADYYFIQGQAYNASTFGEYDANGVWKPKTSPTIDYSGTGNNSCHLKFENSSNMDLDSGDNNLTFTTSGNLTQTLDTPSNVYCTMNPLFQPRVNTVSTASKLYKGNTLLATSDADLVYTAGTLGVTKGKWYWEVQSYSGFGGAVGVCYDSMQSNTNAQFWDNSNILGTAIKINGNNLNGKSGESGGALGVTYVEGDIYGFALDMDNYALYAHINGTYVNSGDPTSGASKTGSLLNLLTSGTAYLNSGEPVFPFIADLSTTGSVNIRTNFGNGYFDVTPISSAGSNGNGSIFEYDVPTGYYALNTKNLATYG